MNGVLVRDECCLFSAEADTKSMRMLGDDPENTMLVEMANPWNIDNLYYLHWNDEKFKQFHIDYPLAIQEGRTTEEFVDERRRELTSLEFQVLYESRFPDQSEDALFSRRWIDRAVSLDLDVEPKEVIVSCDIADKGLDKTVIMVLYSDGINYKLVYIYAEDKSEQADVVDRILQIRKEFNATRIHVDSIGIGVGAVSMLRRYIDHPKTVIEGCNFASAARDKKRFLNIKSEMYFRLAKLMELGRVDIPDQPELISQLASIEWDGTTGRNKIIDPKKSPDFADALVYGIWQRGSSSGYHIA